MANSLLRGRPQRPSCALARPLAALGLLLATAGAAQAQTTTFTYTAPGSAQTYTVPAGITKLNVVATGGAGGGNRGNNKGGFGAVVQATVTVVPGEVLTVVVGGQGADSNTNGTSSVGGAGGYNGGGNGAYTGGGGGGATDLRRATANGSTGDYFTSRNALLVAGGGGAADSGPAGGRAIARAGGNGVSGQGGPAGQGATTTALGGGYLGSNGTGGNGNPNNFNAAGGGGYYGGGGGGGAAGTFSTGLNGGGGGSSYVLPTGSSNVSYSLAASRTNGSLAITPVVPPTNNALAFDGSNDYVSLPASTPVPVGNSAYTIEAWINPTSMGVYGIVGWGNFGTTSQVNALRLDPSNGGQLVNYWWANDLVVQVGNLADGKWHHVAATFNGTTRSLYVDGVLKGSDTPSGHNVPNANNLRLGSTNGGEYFPGSLDEVRIYNAGLTQAQVQADMYSTSPAVPASQQYYANFDQGVAGGNNAGVTSLTDQSGNGNTGTLNNFALTGTSSNWVRSFPTITAISPTSGSAGTSVTLTGTNLLDATSFAFNGTAVSPFTTPTSDLTATVTVPTGATTGPVSVASAALTRYNGPTFTVFADLVVNTTMTIPAGTYNSITVQNGGNGTLADDVVVNSAIVVQSGGRLADGCHLFTGSGTFTLQAGGTLDICRPRGILSSPNTALGNLGAVRVTGARSYSSDASYSYSGGQSQDTGDGLPSQVRNFSVSTSTDISLTNPLAVAQVLTLSGAGNLTTGGKTLTLLSSASGTALVVNNGTGVVNGAATVQRYLATSNAGNGYRHYSAPVSNTTVADLATSGFTPTVNPAYNSSATPGTTTPFPTVFGYDQSRLASTSNNLPAFDKGWFSPAATSDPLAVGRGYTVQLPGTALVDFVGTLTTGTQTVSLSRGAGADAGLALVGNPYPAPLDWSLLNASTDRPGVDGAIYVFASSGPYAGSYRSYVNGQGGNPVVPLGQGFFVRVTPGQSSGSLTFRNAHRLTAPDATAMQRSTADLRPQLALELRTSTGAADAFYAYAEAGATPGLDGEFDAPKLPNPSGLNLSSTSATGEALAIDGRPAFTAGTVLPLAVGVPAAGTYTLALAQLANLPAGLTATLRDAQTGQTLALGAGSSYSFQVTATQATALLTGRFTVTFGTSAPLAASAAALAEQVSIYPNPAREQATVRVPAVAGAGQVQAELLNALGQVVRHQQAALPAAGVTLMLPTTGLAPGVYVLRLTAGPATATKRLVVE